MDFVISMKFFSKFRMLAMLVVGLMAVGTRAEAQGLSLSVTSFGKSRRRQQFADLHDCRDQSDRYDSGNTLVTNALTRPLRSTFQSGYNP